MVSFLRVLRSGATNFLRNKWLSAASTLVMVITLIILCTLSLLFIMTSYSVNTIRQRVDISAYFKTGLADSQINMVKQDMQNDPRVKSVTYVSADQALANFKERHKNDPVISGSIGELSENPLPATLQIKANDLADFQAIAQTLSGGKYQTTIDKVNYEDNSLVIERLRKLLAFVIAAGIALVATFSVIAVLVIFNTITLTIYNRREEVEIMRLVGATNWYIRGPFIVEALMYSIVATIITTALLIPLYITLVPKINLYLGTGDNIFSHGFANLPVLIFLQLVVAIVLSIVSSMLAIRRYLRI